MSCSYQIQQTIEQMNQCPCYHCNNAKLLHKALTIFHNYPEIKEEMILTYLTCNCNKLKKYKKETQP